MKKNKYFYDCAYTSLNHKNEQLCGDKVEIIKKDNMVTMVLADGLGSGVKANILATLTSKILGTMLSEDVSIEECVDAIIKTLPVCSVRHVAYSTFSIVQIVDDIAYFIQYDNPKIQLFRHGTKLDYKVTTRIIDDKKIYETRIKLELDDAIFMYSDGVIHAGVGRFYNFGWSIEEVVNYTEIFYKDYYTAKSLSMLIGNASNELYDGQPGDDTTCSVIKVKKYAETTLVIGPPVDESLDAEMVSKFLSYEGYKVVCGGTTSNLVARVLGKTINTNFVYEDKNIPPIAFIDSIDLVTEGSITLNYAVKILENLNKIDFLDYDFASKKDGASLLVRFLLEKAAVIHIIVGRALNPAHQKYGFPINFNHKLELIGKLVIELRRLGRKVTVEYY